LLLPFFEVLTFVSLIADESGLGDRPLSSSFNWFNHDRD
jgi:hypothetical protein